MIKKQYVETRFGQMHIRTSGLENARQTPPLVLLHPMPYSSLFFTRFMGHVTQSRAMIAVDYPGCGGSAPLQIPPTIEAYAQATLDALKALSISQPCDFLGFHTGCLVAAEISLLSPEQVATPILIDIPLFQEDKRQALLSSLSSHRAYTEELSCLQGFWDSDVKPRLGVAPIERAVAIFADHLQAEGDAADGFRAAFQYPVQERLAAVQHQTLIIATSSGLYDGTIASAKLIGSSELIELPDITKAVFEAGAEKVAALVNKVNG